MSEERKIKENKNGAARTATVSPFNFANYRSSRSVCEAGAAISVSSFYRCFRWRIRHRGLIYVLWNGFEAEKDYEWLVSDSVFEDVTEAANEIAAGL